MRTGTAATMKPGETKVRTRAGCVGVFVRFETGNRVVVSFSGREFVEYLDQLEIVKE